MQKGIVYWITGLSGAGKTTIGKELYQHMKKKKSDVVFLDGDELREVFGSDLGYTLSDRLTCAKRYSKICKLFSEQGINVIMCTISMFDEIREWNQKNIRNYKEIYVKVSMDILKERNTKGLYRNEEDEAANVVGIDLNVELPKNPDVIIENDGLKPLDELLDKLYSCL